MNHDDRELEWMRRQLDAALPGVDPQLHADLWPRMLRRMEEAPAVPSFGWFEAVLATVVVITVAAFPKLLPALLYHL